MKHVMFISLMTAAMIVPLFGQITADPADSLQLINLYNSTDGPNWSSSWVWDLTQPVSNWDGVSINSAGQVVYLDLGGKGLAGTLPQLTLPELLTFEAYGNSLIGPVPSFAGCPNLTSLQMWDNDLSGSLPSFAACANLINVDLSENNLSGNMPDFSPCTNLEILRLQWNNLTGNIPDLQNAQLRILWLSYNNLSGSIPAFSALNSLEQFEAEQNNLSGTIPNFNLPNLQWLLLGHNSLNSVPSFTSLPSLTVLELFDNSLSGPIPDFSISTLGKLDLGQCNFSGTIPTLLGCPNLWHFNAGDNYGIFGSVPDFGSTHPMLQELFLQADQLSDCPSLVGLTNLSRLVLLGNHFTFEDLLPQVGLASNFYFYDFQADIEPVQFGYTISAGDDFELHMPIDSQVTSNVYTWYKNGVSIGTSNTNSLWLNNLSTTDAGQYHCLATNPALPDLTLELLSFQLLVTPAPPMILNSADSMQLVGLYNDTNGPSWATTWDLTQAAATWNGISINANGRVSAIDLSNNGLAGTLPALDLPELINLNLENNALTDAIPSFVATPSLTDLLLANNLFDACPLLSSRSASLDTVSLDGNRLTFEDLLPNVGINRLSYAPQASTVSQDVPGPWGSDVELHFPIDSAISSNVYVWYKDGIAFDTVMNNSLLLSMITPADSGEYSCIATNSMMPDLSLELDPFDLIITGVNALDILSSADLTLYPNPTSDFLTISLNSSRLINSNHWTIRILDLSGRVLIEQRGQRLEQLSINIQHLPMGSYIADLQGATYRWTQTWIKAE